MQETERGDRFGGLAHGNHIAARRRYQAVRTTSDAHNGTALQQGQGATVGLLRRNKFALHSGKPAVDWIMLQRSNCAVPPLFRRTAS